MGVESYGGLSGGAGEFSLGRGLVLGRWARRLVAFVVAGAAGVALASFQRLLWLPVGAQSAISTALGSGDSRFAAVPSGSGYRLRGGGVQARLGARGADLRASGVSLSSTLIGLGRGGRLGRPGVVSVSARANRVVFVYDRGLLREWYAAGSLGIEQGFTLTRRPGGTGGPVSPALNPRPRLLRARRVCKPPPEHATTLGPSQ
jgi:hypothetical protein